ncbi:unnamed protein product, partial [Allacma fusca]
VPEHVVPYGLSEASARDGGVSALVSVRPLQCPAFGRGSINIGAD